MRNVEPNLERMLDRLRRDHERRRRVPLTGEIRKNRFLAPGALVRIDGIVYAHPWTRRAILDEWRSLEPYPDALAEARLRSVEAMRWADDGGPA